ncbi:hypothetical protein ACOMHN_037442 [Nucella lapillus]
MAWSMTNKRHYLYHAETKQSVWKMEDLKGAAHRDQPATNGQTAPPQLSDIQKHAGWAVSWHSTKRKHFLYHAPSEKVVWSIEEVPEVPEVPEADSSEEPAPKKSRH